MFHIVVTIMWGAQAVIQPLAYNQATFDTAAACEAGKTDKDYVAAKEGLLEIIKAQAPPNIDLSQLRTVEECIGEENHVQH